MPIYAIRSNFTLRNSLRSGSETYTNFPLIPLGSKTARKRLVIEGVLIETQVGNTKRYRLAN